MRGGVRRPAARFPLPAQQFAELRLKGGGIGSIQAAIGLSRLLLFHAAEALDRTTDLGAIAPGRYGDIIAVDGNPLQDVRALRNVAFVMKAGKVEKPAF